LQTVLFGEVASRQQTHKRRVKYNLLEEVSTYNSQFTVVSLPLQTLRRNYLNVVWHQTAYCNY